MNIEMHHTETVTIEKTQYDTFATLILKFKNGCDQEMTVTLFTDDLTKLNINTATIETREY